MPSHEIHDFETLILAPFLGLVVMVLLGLELAIVYTLATIGGGLLFSPDLDHQAGARCYRRWGPLRIIWWPYLRILPHRSAFSHWPVLGTAGRLLYLAVLACPFLLYGVGAGTDWAPALWDWMDANRVELLVGVAGLETSAILHFTADLCLRS